METFKYSQTALILLALAKSLTQGQKIVLEIIQGKNLDEQSNMKKKRQKKMLEVTPRTIGTESVSWLGYDQNFSHRDCTETSFFLLKKICLLI